MPWYYNPHSGGTKIPPHDYEKLRTEVHAYEQTRSWYPKFSIRLRFKNQFCYLDSCENGDEISPLGRLRFISRDQWSLAFFTYSNERYEPCSFPDGKLCGSITDAIDVCSFYLV